MDEEKLIEGVQSFPCLWNVFCKGYRNQRAKEIAWKAIASEVRQVTKKSSLFLVRKLQKQETVHRLEK